MLAKSEERVGVQKGFHRSSLSCTFGYHLREFSHLFDLGGGVHLLTRWTFDGISILSKSSVMLLMSLMASHILVGEVVKFLALFSRLCEGKIEPNRDEGGKRKISADV